jgi:multiple sugar transport system permease protein
VRKRGINNFILGNVLILPALITILAVRAYPVLNGFYLSLTDKNLFSAKKENYIGMDNFIKLILKDHEFHYVICFSLAYTVSVVLFSYLVGMAFALLLNNDIKFKGVFRALILIPWVIPPAVGAANFLSILNDEFGIVNEFLKNIGVIQKSIKFIADMSVVRITVIIYGVWRSFPFMMIVLLSGLQSIPIELYEAAYAEGANRIKSFFYITLPLLKKVTFISSTLMLLWTFYNFENIYLLTGGGPVNRTMVLSILTYNTAFYRGQMGYASSIAAMMSIFMLVICVLNRKATD